MKQDASGKFARLHYKLEVIDNLILEYEASSNSTKKFSANHAKVKIYVLCHGENRNGSSFTKECVEGAIATLGSIPIVGEWKKYDDGSFGFGGHGGKLEITDTSMTFIDTTTPYGFIPKDVNWSWEKVTEKNGVDEEEYLVCDGYLFLDKYKEQVNYILNNGAWQSMEIEIVDGYYDDNWNLVVNDFKFSALCILNKSEDKAKNVEPCFTEAQIINQGTFSKFQTEFKEMLREFYNNERGDIRMKFNKNYLPKQYTYISHNENEVYVVDKAENNVCKFNYDLINNGDSPSLNLTAETILYKLHDSNAEIEIENTLIYKALKDKYEGILEINKQYEAKEKQVVISKFDGLIDKNNESYKSIKEELQKYNIDELNKELKVIYADQLMYTNKEQPKKIQFSAHRVSDTSTINDDEYSKYF